MSVLQPQPMRGAGLLLVHCAAVVDADERPSAYSRLEQQLGGELTRLLVVALSGPHGLRGSSSP